MTGGNLVWTAQARDTLRVVSPAGRIDESTATAFAEHLAQEIEVAAGDGAKQLAIDLSLIDYMSSRGLRGLTLAQRKSGDHGITIVLVQPNDIMREILAISRYDMVFKVYDTIELVPSGAL
ncbi:STAS domain-containing protein [Novosphingobium lentum]|uniref:STAS domain-containing protein n=1 Tax=Novosphingobium lentum TaxID=145287 RepID=UPI000B24895D|nr:STAS domain-containing protein [Novosphingobium lentum]